MENIYHPLVIGKDQVPPNMVGRFVQGIFLSLVLYSDVVYCLGSYAVIWFTALNHGNLVE